MLILYMYLLGYKVVFQCVQMPDRKYFVKVLGPINNHQLLFSKYDISYFYSLFDNAVVSTLTIVNVSLSKESTLL